MMTLAAGLDYVDLNFLGRPGNHRDRRPAGRRRAWRSSIPGPSTTLDEPDGGARAQGHRDRGRPSDAADAHPPRPRRRAPGTLVRQNPAIEVFVHERGAPHLIDPSKLLASAGAALRRATWIGCGETFCRCPPTRVTVAAGRGADHRPAAASSRSPTRRGTPRITSATSIRRARVAFVGDTAGIRRGGRDLRHAADAAARHRPRGLARSADRILAWDPDTLFLTHFGPFHGARVHFQDTDGASRRRGARIVRRLLADASLDEDQRERLRRGSAARA